MPRFDDYLSGNPDQQQAAYYYLNHTDNDAHEALEAVVSELLSASSFAQLQRVLDECRDDYKALLDDRARARAVFRGAR